jgi:hypothetical protein
MRLEMEEVTGGCKVLSTYKLHKFALDQFSQENQVKRYEMGGRITMRKKFILKQR